jgi:tRNA pseudouridine55 synthase
VTAGPLADPSLGGLVLVDKPAGVTSHDVVAVVRRAARTRRVGHAGTLDPFATGLLVLAVGPATRLLAHLDGEPKVYEATIRFGWETDTDDATGIPARAAPPPPDDLLEEPNHPLRVAAEMALTGMLSQRPPSFSAKHVDGVRAYDLARRGDLVELPAVPVTVFGWRWLGGRSSEVDVEIRCGAGTYIRSLARDLGRRLGSAAHCSRLRRVASGPLSVTDAIPMGDLVPGSLTDGTHAVWSPLGALGHLAREELSEAQLAAVGQGRSLPASAPGAAGDRGVLVHGGEVVAIAERLADDRWQPRVVLRGAAA